MTDKEKLIEFILGLTDEEVERILARLNEKPQAEKESRKKET